MLKKRVASKAKTGKSKRIIVVVLIIGIVFFAIAVLLVVISLVGRTSESAISQAYSHCITESGDSWFSGGYFSLLDENTLLVSTKYDDREGWGRIDDIVCILEDLDGRNAFSAALDEVSGFDTLKGFEFGDYAGVFRLSVSISDDGDNRLMLAIYARGDNLLASTSQVCNNMYNVMEEFEVTGESYEKSSKLVTLDDGKTLSFSGSSNSFVTEKRNCVYSMLNFPERLKIAMETGGGITHKEEWGNLIVEWSSSSSFIVYSK